MSNVWFTSDLHYGHKGIMKHCEDFSTEEERSHTINQNIASRVSKRDILWILGDSVFTEERLSLLDEIKCTKFLVIGNHCGVHIKDLNNLYGKFDKVLGVTKRYGCWIQHTPMHPSELYGKFSLHGHSHRGKESDCLKESISKDPRYICMCIEQHNYMPKDLRWLRKEMESRKELMRVAYQ